MVVEKSIMPPSPLRCSLAFARTWCSPRHVTLRPSRNHACSHPFTTSHARKHSPSPSPLISSSSASVNPTEVSHFNALASTWWDPTGSSRLLHLMNPLRHDFISSCLSSAYDPSPHTGIRYLDVGCGGGIFAESAARLSTTEYVLGLDPSEEVISIAQQHAQRDPLFVSSSVPSSDDNVSSEERRRTRLEYRQTSIEALDVPKSVDQQYDVLTLFEVVEHVTHPGPFLEKCLPFVKPGGWLILSTIARTWTSWITTKIVAEDVVGIVPQGTHDWAKYINEEELRRWFAKREGWERTRATGVVYVPGFGWREVRGAEKWGNYFFGVRKND